MALNKKRKGMEEEGAGTSIDLIIGALLNVIV